MSFHFCSHSWEVSDVEDGTLVKLTPRDLVEETVHVMVEELLELARESGRPNVYLDLSDIRTFPSIVLAKLLSLDTKLHEHGGRAVLLHVDRHLYGIFEATRLTEVLDVRPDAALGSVA
jgi:anti-anti-sigma factor